MSRNQQKKVHNDRRAERQKERERKRKPPKSVIRVHLMDGVYVFYTTLILLAVIAAIVVMQLLGWFDGIFGAVLSVIMGGIAVLCVFDLALLLTACVTIADGQVNAGKNESGQLMIFHAENVVAVELRDKEGNTVPEDRRRYSKVAVTFVMASGRINQRPMGHIRQRQLSKLRRALKEPAAKSRMDE